MDWATLNFNKVLLRLDAIAPIFLQTLSALLSLGDSLLRTSDSSPTQCAMMQLSERT